MTDVTLSVEQQIVDEVRKLNKEQQRRVLDFMHALIRPPTISGREFLERTRNIRIDPSDLEIMSQAADEDCEQINEDEWDKPIFPD